MLKYKNKERTASIDLPASKSIANRLLIAQALAKKTFKIENLSHAEDTRILQAALASKEDEYNLGMAGTAYRFLTAYHAIQTGSTTTLSGAPRMHQRPIGILVEALQQLGAEIEYLEESGFPPLRINGKSLVGGKVSLDGSVSSQFISALLLIAPALSKGIEIEIEDELISKPYVEMTLRLMNRLSIETSFREGKIKVDSGAYTSKLPVKVEADWSSAAFFYQFLALSDHSEIEINELITGSIQGDKRLIDLFEYFGLTSTESAKGILVKKTAKAKEQFDLDMIDCPDLIPSVAVCAAILSREVIISGIKSLRIKESNRVKALQLELAKIGAELVDLNQNQMMIKGSQNLPEKVEFKTYNDHRMAMSLAPLAAIIKAVSIENTAVVDKSFPSYWQEIEKCGFLLN